MCRWLATAIADSAAPSLLAGGVDSSEAAEVPEPLAGVPVPNPPSGSSGDPSPPLPGLGVPLSPALASGLSPIAQPFPSSGLDPFTQPFPSEPPEQSPLHPAEALAASLLGGSTAVTEADLLRVHALLPRKAPSRGGELGEPGFSLLAAAAMGKADWLDCTATRWFILW